MSDTTQTPETPAQKTQRRTGRCGAMICNPRCEEFAYDGSMDGFKLCECTHTQNSHALREARHAD